MRKVVVPIRPACTMGVSIYCDSGESFFSEHRILQTQTPQITGLIEAVKQDIGNLPSFRALQAAIGSLPHPTQEAMDPEQVQTLLQRNADEAALVQDIYQEAALVVTINPAGAVCAGFSVPPLRSAWRTPRQSASCEIRSGTQEL